MIFSAFHSLRNIQCIPNYHKFRNRTSARTPTPWFVFFYILITFYDHKHNLPILLSAQRRLEALSEAKAISDAKVSSLEQLVRSLRADLKASKKAEKEQKQQINALKEDKTRMEQQGASKVSTLKKQNGGLKRETERLRNELQETKGAMKELESQRLDFQVESPFVNHRFAVRLLMPHRLMMQNRIEIEPKEITMIRTINILEAIKYRLGNVPNSKQ